MTENVKSSFAYQQDLPLGVLNRLNRDITRRRLDPDQESNFSSILTDIFDKVYGVDISAGSGPYAAVVLDVLTGPQANNSAQNNDLLNSKGTSAVGPDPLVELAAASNSPPPVTVIAKIPEMDADIPWPDNDKDQKRIQLHGEFRQRDESPGTPGITNITQGSIIWVQYIDNDTMASHSGGPTGYIVGVHTSKALSKLLTIPDLKNTFNPPCKITIDKNKPAPGFYVGDGTDPDPFSSLVDFKIKNHIKTGMYGGGHPRTKAHFKAALSSFKNAISFKHKFGAPAPGPDNAFIWIGHLKNNGYMDLLDRPNDKGRETIIYAPATLDLNAPVEIKYYLHDVGGFGAAHVNGPNMSIGAAEAAVGFSGNDFAEKIAPAILDLNTDGRNYVLVIPEMAYSRGYGTENDNINRVDKLIAGVDIGPGRSPESTATTVRTSPTSEIRGLLKSYLSTIPVESGKTLAQNTPLRLRQLSTFDGTYSGGDFGKFHDEVLDVLDEYIYNSVGGVRATEDLFVSFVADGLGAIALSSILNKVANSTTQADAATSLKNLFNSEIGLRIDYITTPEMDSSPNFYSSFGVQSPSSVLVNELILPREDIFYTEFNYIMSPTSLASNTLFNNLGKIEDYKKHSNNPGTGANANKFSFRLGSSEGDQRFATFHVVKEKQPSKKNHNTKVGYAFSMVNKFLPNSIKYPKKGDKNSQLKPGFAGVPDHHQALSSAKNPSAIDKLTKQLDELEAPIKYFSGALNKISRPGPGLDTAIGSLFLCQDKEYKIFCNENEVVDQNEDSLFSAEYRKHLRRLKKLEEIKILLDPNQGAPFIEKNRLSRKSLENLQKQYFILDENTKKQIDEVADGESIRDVWNLLNTGIVEYSRRSFASSDVQNLAFLMARPEAYAKLKNKTDSYIQAFVEPDIKKPEDCVPPPIKLADAGMKTATTIRPKDSNCEEISSLLINPPEDFRLLARMLGYAGPYGKTKDPALPPTKKDFKFSKNISKTRIKESNLPRAFKTETFKYNSRGPSNVPLSKVSPHVWACISSKISEKWNEACQRSKYFPYIITSGVKASEKLNTRGVTAYNKGLSLHAFGLGIDIDPHLNAQSTGPRNPIYSVWTGAWSRNLLGGPLDKDILKNFKRLHQLGVFREKPEELAKNIFVDKNFLKPHSTAEWQNAPSASKKQSPDSARSQKYDRAMSLNSNQHEFIVPLESNPTLWVIEFCNLTGFRWGNANFLKTRYKGGKTWSEPEQKEISDIYGIPNVVKRIQAISWNAPWDQHMRFDFWAGETGLIPWKEIQEFVKSRKKRQKSLQEIDALLDEE